MKPNVGFLLRLTADERKALDNMAAKQLRSANSVLRAMIRREAEQGGPTVVEPVEQPRRAA